MKVFGFAFYPSRWLSRLTMAGFFLPAIVVTDHETGLILSHAGYSSLY